MKRELGMASALVVICLALFISNGDVLGQSNAVNTLRQISMLGIYALEGDELKLCLPQPGRDRPTAFAAPEKSGTTLLVFRREKP